MPASGASGLSTARRRHDRDDHLRRRIVVSVVTAGRILRRLPHLESIVSDLDRAAVLERLAAPEEACGFAFDHVEPDASPTARARIP